MLPEIVLAHNSVLNRTTNLPPCYALYGRQSSVSQLFVDQDNDINSLEEEESMRELWTSCMNNQLKAKEVRQKENF